MTTEFDRVVLEQQRRSVNESAPSDTSAILRELTSPPSARNNHTSVEAKIQELTFAERKDAKKVLVNALQGLIERLDVNSSVASETHINMPQDKRPKVGSNQ